MVTINSDRRYTFDTGVAAVWKAMSSVDQFTVWWPWLRRLAATELAPGESWECLIQPPLPYAVRVGIAFEDVVEPALIVATVRGDITGRARVDLAETEGGCTVRLRSELSPSNRLLRAMSILALPIARFGHDWVLDNGARQFRARAL